MRGVPSALAALAFGGRDGGNLTAFAAALPLPSDTSPSPVAFVIEVDAASLLSSRADGLELQFFAYAIDRDHRVRGHFSQRLPIALEDLETASIDGGLRYQGHLELPPGEFVVRFLVREPESGRYGLRTVQLQVPAPATQAQLGQARVNALGQARGSAPVGLRFPRQDDGWLEARERPETITESDSPTRPAIDLPPALPVLAPGEEQELEVVFYGPPPRERLLNLSILDATGAKVGKVELKTNAEPTTLTTRLHLLPMSFTVPALEDGSYGLELESASTAELEHPPQAAVLVLAAAAGRSLRWTDMTAAALAGPRPDRPARAGAGPGSKAARAIATAYRTALSRYALGEDQVAIEEIAQLEAKAVERGGDEPMRELIRGEWYVATSLGEQDPEALLPLMALHLELDNFYRDKRDFLLASHSRRMAVSLATEYAQGVDTPEAGTIVAQALTVLGTDLQELQLWSAAQRLLEKALEFDPDNSLAVLSLALGFEKRGFYREAVGYLERLVDHNPKSAEGRLRLALNLRRIGQGRRAAGLLRRIIGEANPAWTLTIAYQELARMALGAGRAADAVRLLEDGVARLPRERRLRLLRAYALDRAGDTRAGDQVIAELARVAPRREPTPRYLYNRRIQGDREEIRRSLTRNSTLRLAALADSLASGGGG